MPPEHAVPSAFGVYWHVPSIWQTPSSWHSSAAAHMMGVGTQTADSHMLDVHASPSSHAVPSRAGGSEHKPVPESHVPAT